MPLLVTVTKLEDVNEKYRSLYTEKDGVFTLDKDVQSEDITPLKNAKEHEKQERLKAQVKLDELAEEKLKWEIREAELKGETEKAERLKQEALDKQKADYESAHKEENSSLKDRIYNLTVGKLQSEIAAEVYLRPGAMNLEAIKNRIKLNDKDEAYIVDSNDATMSKSEYIKELRADKDMAPFIKAGDGSGGGSHQHKQQQRDHSGLSDMDKKKARLKAKDPTLE